MRHRDILVDVVLSDIDVPGSINGFGFAQRARSVRPELKILLAGIPGRTVQNAAELGDGAVAEEALRAQARAGSHEAAARRSGAGSRLERFMSSFEN